MVGWWSACQLGWLDGARDVWLVSWLVVEDGEAGREAVCLDEWLVVEDGEAGREAVWVVELSAWMVGWWSACELGWLDGARDVWLVSGWWSRMVRLVVRLSGWSSCQFRW